MLVYASWIGIEDIRKESILSSLETQRVTDLKHLIDNLDLPLKKSGRKEDLKNRIYKFSRLYPDYILSRLPAHEIELTRRLQTGETIYADREVIAFLYCIYRLGWIVLRETEEDTRVNQVILLDEVSKLLGNRLSNFEISRECRIARVVKDLGALWGIVPLVNVVDILSGRPEFEGITNEEVLRSVERYCDYSHIHIIPELIGTNFKYSYMTEWTRIVGKPVTLIINEKECNGKIVRSLAYQPKEFSYEEIMEASMPLFAPRTPNSSELRKVMDLGKKYKLAENDIKEVILETWIEKQQDNTHFNFDSLLKKLQVSSIEDLNEWIQVLTQYSNTMPFWSFMGHSSAEEFANENMKSRKAPRLVAGPNMRAAGMDISEGLQEKIDEMWSDRFGRIADNSNSKVGRNDPCPCGSGLKYKKCCGKNA